MRPSCSRDAVFFEPPPSLHAARAECAQRQRALPAAHRGGRQRDDEDAPRRERTRRDAHLHRAGRLTTVENAKAGTVFSKFLWALDAAEASYCVRTFDSLQPGMTPSLECVTP